MPETLAYLNGRFVPFSQAAVHVSDMGFVMGVTVAEQLRTFGGKLFRLEAHLDRLRHSLEIVGVDPGISFEELSRISQELAHRNHRQLDPADDLNLAMFVTPGTYPSMAVKKGDGQSDHPNGSKHSGPTVCIHTVPLPFHLWVDKYARGEWLVTTSIEQVSPACWPRELKCRSRMHYYLADRQAASIEPGARALLVDHEGFVTEATTANVVAYFAGQGLVGPPREKVLHGISLAVLLEIAQREGLPYSERDLKPADLEVADELFLCSTTLSVMPVVRFNGRPIGGGESGTVQELLTAGWSRMVGLDIVAQAMRFADR